MWNWRGNRMIANATEQRHGDERAAIDRAGDSIQRSNLRRLREQVAKAIEHHEGHETADNDEGDQLDDRLGRHGQHQPVLVLAGVDGARAEEHRKGRHRHGDQERNVGNEGRVERYDRRFDEQVHRA
jgi:hypothetical protein